MSAETTAPTVTTVGRSPFIERLQRLAHGGVLRLGALRHRGEPRLLLGLALERALLSPLALGALSLSASHRAER